MSDKNKNKKSTQSDFLRYRSGEMSGAERNSFERELQKDPFADEAAEGLDSLSANAFSEDISILQKRIKSRTTSNRRLLYYGIAASIAVLMVISGIYIVVEKSNTNINIAVQAIPEKSPEIKQEQPLAVLAENKKATEKQVLTDDSKSRSVNNRSKRMETSQGAGAVEKVKDAVLSVTDSVSEIEVNNINATVNERLAVAPIASKGIAATKSLFITRGKVISSEDNLPLPGAAITIKGTNTAVLSDLGGNFSISLPDSARRTLVVNAIGMASKEFTAKADSQVQLKLDPDLTSLSEVVVVGYGTKRADYEDYEAPSGYTSPQPSIGKNAFNRYIEENLIRPESLPSGQRVAVVVSFIVHTNGSTDSIKIVRSPDKSFSDEAIRLIKTGPAWKPALQDGKVIEDEVRVRIVFR